MARDSKRRTRRVLWPLIVTLVPLLIYLLTLAPTVLWGDDAYFQRTACTGELRPDGGGHWLWLQAARLFVRLPWGDVAFRSNLLSAIAATGTILVLYAAARQAGLRRDAAAVAVISLAVGHTFWMHAVRAEVYSVFTFFVALHFWLWARWRPDEKQPEAGFFRDARPLYGGAAVFGLTLLAHQMALLLFPAWIVFVWLQRGSLRGAQVGKATAFLIAGLVPFFLVVESQIVLVANVSMIRAVWLYFTQAGADFSSSFFDFSLAAMPRDLATWALLTLLQFCSPALVLIPWGLVDRLRSGRPKVWIPLLAFYLFDVLFAVSYRVNDRYAFLLPGYVALALFTGAGWQAARAALASRQRPSTVSVAMAGVLVAGSVLVLVMPIAVYYVAPRAMAALNLNPLDVRRLPGREPNAFFLWPGKGGYLGARQYGEQTLAALPPAATLFADHTPLETLRYLQAVEGIRPDVQILKIEPGENLAPLIDSLPPESPIYLADDNTDYYNLLSLPEADLIATGPVYRLKRQER
ncbi:MAG TPA: DUF2723 domain-containing protein [Candidatus Binatia bacterium]|nr:DUF2723 domain-containing protein [Candidatus Binatia bacterium]